MTSLHVAHALPDNVEVDERMRALASIYQLTDSILAGERLKVEVVRNSTMIPAWTNGTTISLNAEQIDTRDFKDIVKVHGLNFHELAHVLFSPRAGTSFMKWIAERKFNYAANILEDQRIETFLTTKYPSTAPWLTASVLRWAVRNPSSIGTGYPFLRGRRYLPGEMRGLFRAHFERQDLLPEIDSIIDAYRKLTYPTDYDEGQALIERFQDILSQVWVGPDPYGHNQGSPSGEPGTGRPKPVKEQREIRDRLEDEKAEDEVPPDQGQPDKAEGDTRQGDTTDSDSSDGQDSGLGDDTEGDDDDGDEVGGSGAGNRPNHLDARDALRDMLDDLMSSEEVRNDVRRTQTQINTATGSDLLPMSNYVEEEPLPEFISRAHQLARALEVLRQESEPGWHREQDLGRLNVVRWAVDRDPTTAFDRWDEGVQDATDIEAVIMLDSSGSMGGVYVEAFNAMWALKRAFDLVEMSTTVISFDDSNKVLYRNVDQANALVRVDFQGGGTDPTRGLAQAARIMAGSSRSHKVLIILTDGDWYGGWDEFQHRAEDYVRSMRESGVVTVLGLIGEAPSDGFMGGPPAGYRRGGDGTYVINEHGCATAALASGDNLIPLVSGIITDLIRSQIRAHR